MSEEINRRVDIDLLRILASIIVVFFHVCGILSYSDRDSFDWKILCLLKIISSSGVPIFFMISGVLFLNKKEINSKNYIKKQIIRFLIMWLFWNTFYTAWAMGITYSKYVLYLDNLLEMMKKTTTIFQYVITNPREYIQIWMDGFYHLWFMPALIMVNLLMPAIWALIHKEKVNVQYLLILLSGFVVCNFFVEPLSENNSILLFITEKFSTKYWGYALYGVLGYCLANKCKYRKNKVWLFYFIIYAAIIMLEYVRMIFIRSDDYFGYFCIGSMGGAVIIYIFIIVGVDCYKVYNRKNIVTLLEHIADKTFGIYILHPFILSIIELSGGNVQDMNPIIIVPVISVMVYIFTLIVVEFVKKIPFLRRII